MKKISQLLYVTMAVMLCVACNKGGNYNPDDLTAGLDGKDVVTTGTIFNYVTPIGYELKYMVNSDGVTVTCKGMVDDVNASDIDLELLDTVSYKGIVFPVTGVGDGAFSKDNFSGQLKLPNSLVGIGKMAFQSCTGLKGGLKIGESVVTIGDEAFVDCKQLVGELTIPNSVTSIGWNAFAGCGFNGQLTIGESVTSIGNRAFAKCYGISSVVNLAPTPQPVNIYLFENVNMKTRILYVPANSVDAYKKAIVWKDFKQIVAIK